jgi:GAF domain-containing protein
MKPVRLWISGTAAQSAAFSMAIGSLLAVMPALAAVSLNGQVLGGGAPVANSNVTLWAATASGPVQLGQARTGADGRFTISAAAVPAKDASLYLVARGGKSTADKSSGNNPAIALLSVLGGKAPSKITINEMTTVASVWTNAQFLDGAALKGHALGLKIAAGEIERVYTTDATAYPTGGRKLKRDTAWTRQVLGAGEPYFANDEAGIRAAFDDADRILALGLGAVMNVPVRHGGRVVGTLNFLREAGGYAPADVPKALALAPLAAAALAS